ncbi:MAG: exonuclease domain-containing protein [Pseudomonadota bacterium]|nr:exonuclease domain-containing protein [Pseudomonadota bacterium]
MLVWPLILDLRRRLRLRKAPAGPLRDYLAVEFPKPSRDYRSVDYLAVDLETTGLDPRRDGILSVGYVAVHGNRIDLGNASHRLVLANRAIPEASAIIHQITDDQAALGEPLRTVLEDLLGDLAGKVMIAHHAAVERAFLDVACRHLFGAGLLMPIIDTQALAQRTFERRHVTYKGSDLRLHALGERYNLPRYGAHNALSDALAAAELFLAQAAYRESGRGAALREFLC